MTIYLSMIARPNWYEARVNPKQLICYQQNQQSINREWCVKRAASAVVVGEKRCVLNMSIRLPSRQKALQDIFEIRHSRNFRIMVQLNFNLLPRFPVRCEERKDGKKIFAANRPTFVADISVVMKTFRLSAKERKVSYAMDCYWMLKEVESRSRELIGVSNYREDVSASNRTGYRQQHLKIKTE